MKEVDYVGITSTALLFAKCSLVRSQLDSGYKMQRFEIRDILRYRFIYPNTYKYYTTSVQHNAANAMDIDSCERDFLFHIYESR